MTNISSLRKLNPIDERHRIADRLIKIKKELETQGVPQRNVSDSLLLATWNLRDFDSNKFGHGKRLRESFFYLAEIISAFDIVALQEVNKDLSGLRELMGYLGSNWDYIVTDETGNGERGAFVYDKNKVWFRNIAGEIVLPYKAYRPSKKEVREAAAQADALSAKDFTKWVEAENALNPNRQFNRTPFLVAFQSGWFKFKICTVHMYYGASSGIKLERRKREIREVAKFLKKRADKDADSHYILLGDFNIVDTEHGTMEALVDNGFTVPEELQKSNVKETMFYDQIAFRLKDRALMPKKANIFKFEKAVFRRDDFPVYKSVLRRISSKAKKLSVAKRESYYVDEWRTFQMSDHNLMWVELQIDFSGSYLKDRKKDVE